MELIIIFVAAIVLIHELIEHPQKHGILITILCIIGGIFLGFMDFTGATNQQKNRMRGKRD